MMWLLHLSTLGWGADPDTTVYVVGKYATNMRVIRANDPSDSNATGSDGRTVPTSAATNGFVGVALDPLTQILFNREQGNQVIQAHDANNLTPFFPMDITLDPSTICSALEIDPFRSILYVSAVDAYSINHDGATGNFGDLLSASGGTSSGVACADSSDGNQLVRDPTNNLLYCYDTEGSSAVTYVYSWSTKNHLLKPAKFIWATPSTLTASSSAVVGTSNGAIALDFDNRRLCQARSSSPTREFTVISFTAAVNNGTTTNRTTSVLADIQGTHFVTYSTFGTSKLLVETHLADVCFYVWSTCATAATLTCDTPRDPAVKLLIGPETLLPADRAVLCAPDCTCTAVPQAMGHQVEIATDPYVAEPMLIAESPLAEWLPEVTFLAWQARGAYRRVTPVDRFRYLGVPSDPQQLRFRRAQAAEATPMPCNAVKCRGGTTPLLDTAATTSPSIEPSQPGLPFGM